MSPEMRPESFETCEKRAPGVRNVHLQCLCVAQKRRSHKLAVISTTSLMTTNLTTMMHWAGVNHWKSSYSCGFSSKACKGSLINYRRRMGNLKTGATKRFWVFQAKVQDYYKQMNDLVTETYSEEDQQIIGCPSIQQVG